MYFGGADMIAARAALPAYRVCMVLLPTQAVEVVDEQGRLEGKREVGTKELGAWSPIKCTCVR